MIKTAQKVIKSKGFQQSALTVVGNNVATAIAAISLIIISRILGPEQFGDFSVGVAIILILTRLIDLGVSTSILRFASSYKSKKKINSVISYTSRLKATIALVVITISIAFTAIFLNKVNLGNEKIVHMAILLSLIIVAYDHLLTILQSFHLFSKAVLLNLIQAITKLLGILLFVFLSIKDATIIFFLYAASPLISLLFTKKMIPTWLKLDFNQNFIQEKNEIDPFIKHASLGVVAVAVIENISILFTRHYLNAYETGLLGGVMRIAMVILLTANSLGVVLYPRVAKYKKRTDIKKYIKKASVLSFLILVGFTLFVPISKLLIYLTIGPEYIDGNLILLILSAASFVTLATVPFIALFFSFDAPWYFSITGLLQILLVICGNYFFVPLYGLEAAAITSLVTRVVVLILTVVFGLWLYVYKSPKYHK